MANLKRSGIVEERGGGETAVEDRVTAEQRKSGGWKAMPFILGNETFERLASFSLLANFMVYLRREYHMSQVDASNVINVWSGISNFAPLFGAFISDAYFGRFRVIAISSLASFVGILTLTLTAWIPGLRPPKCQSPNPNAGECIGPGPNKAQLAILILALAFLSIGSGGIRPCSIPFGVDQFDLSTEEGRRSITSYYNWYYTTFTIVVMFALTVMVYVQDSVSWVVGFGIPAIFMVCSIVVFLAGTRLYVYVAPEGSAFSDIAHTAVAAFKKRRLKISNDTTLFDPPFRGPARSKLCLTDEYKFLNKAAIVEEGELNPDGTCAGGWRLSSVQKVEELKCLLRVLPVWASGVLCLTAAAQQWTFAVSQALVMERRVGGGGFVIPAGSITALSMLTVAVWLPLYDRLVVPALRRLTRREEGISLLQRMGVGIVISIAAMLVAGVVEKRRRELMLTKHVTMSVFWLAPQQALLGLGEAFNFIGQIEFYNKQFPENMSSLATALFFVAVGCASYISSLLIDLVNGLTGGHGPGHYSWLDSSLDRGKLDRFYYLVALLGFLNLVYFLVVSVRYRYKRTQIDEEELSGDLELNQVKC